MQNCKPIDTPIEKSYTSSLDQCPKNDEKGDNWQEFFMRVQLEA